MLRFILYVICLLQEVIEKLNTLLFSQNEIDKTCIPILDIENICQEYDSNNYPYQIPSGYNFDSSYNFFLSQPEIRIGNVRLYDENSSFPSWLTVDNERLLVTKMENDDNSIYQLITIVNGVLLTNSNVFIKIVFSNDTEEFINLFEGNPGIFRKEIFPNEDFEGSFSLNGLDSAIINLSSSGRVKYCNICFSIIKLTSQIQPSFVCPSIQSPLIPGFNLQSTANAGINYVVSRVRSKSRSYPVSLTGVNILGQSVIFAKSLGGGFAIRIAPTTSDETIYFLSFSIFIKKGNINDLYGTISRTDSIPGSSSIEDQSRSVINNSYYRFEINVRNRGRRNFVFIKLMLNSSSTLVLNYICTQVSAYTISLI